MRRVLRFCALGLVFTCSMRMWQYYVGVRLQIFDLFLFGFLACFLFRAVVHSRLARVGATWQWALIAKGMVLVLSLLTCLQLDPALAPYSQLQFAKGFFSLMLHAAGLTALVLFLHEDRTGLYRVLLRAYILSAVLASIYSFVEVMVAFLGFDLGKAIFLSISIYPPDFDTSAPFFYQWDSFFRAAGFSGVNTHATFVITAVPILFVASPFRHRQFSLLCATLCLAGSALTMSRTGFFTLCIAGLGYLFLQPGFALKYVPRIAAALIPLIAVFFLFKEQAVELLATRTASSFTELANSRSDISRVVWPVARQRSLAGNGLNQFSVVMERSDRFDVSDILVKYPTKDETWVRQSYANVHNNWLNWVFEGGWPLVLARLLEYGLLMRICWQGRTRFGMVSVAVLGALLVAGYFNMALDVFSTELLFMLLPACVTLAARDARRVPPRVCEPLRPLLC